MWEEARGRGKSKKLKKSILLPSEGRERGKLTSSYKSAGKISSLYERKAPFLL